MSKTDDALERKDAPEESTWNAEALFESWEAWQAELDTMAKALPALSDFAGKLGDGPAFAPASDSDGRSHHVGQTTVPPTGIQSADRERRRTAWEHFCDGYLSFKNTLASIYLTSVKQQVFNIRVRGYKSVLESRLFPSHVPVEVFHNLIDTYKANLSTWHHYWEVKQRALGVKTLHPYDIWAPLVEEEPEVSYEEAIDWVCEGMAPLGDEYASVLRRGCLEDRWVDYAPSAVDHA